ncbi:hypothetical protein PPL_10109 [Heterostelium album PN500]|uniref:Uncharacterized protein n=1 Tax=Heterostelium pallidum (strain ATCC 26659 / Pp 5 / PN500) TaxID=670386 RepID=D3BQC4_HETP5|nr:hypothetical protein PPL_10109 [Heterostelium album PN500]EFA76344.1 hypothetical protein PPL_10109 [Heterostelium album PN500]|eukprot:XP_020428476.1 hypothetical protein PPL_10109 [Heterostelium album PN500]
MTDNNFNDNNDTFTSNDNSNYNNLNDTNNIGPISTIIHFIRDTIGSDDDVKKKSTNTTTIDSSGTTSTDSPTGSSLIDRVESMLGIDDVDEDDKLIGSLFNIKPKRLNEVIFLLGGASLVSFALRTFLFGKTIRAIEIPDGNLTTFVLRNNRVTSLKRTILQNQPPLYPGVTIGVDDIKASAFIDPNFTEPITSNRDVRKLQDGGYVVWTKADFEIPRTSVALKALIKDRDLFIKYSNNSELDKIIRLISQFAMSDQSFIDNTETAGSNNNSNGGFKLYNILLWFTNSIKDTIFTKKNGDYKPNLDLQEPLSTDARDELIMRLLTQRGDDIIQLYRKYQHDINLFRYHLSHYYQTKCNINK